MTQNYIVELYFLILFYSNFGSVKADKTGNLKVCIGVYDFDTRTVTPSQYTSILPKSLEKSREKVRLKRAFGLSDFFLRNSKYEKKRFTPKVDF